MKHNAVDYLSCVTCPLVVRQSTNARDGTSQRKLDCPGPSFLSLIYFIYYLCWSNYVVMSRPGHYVVIHIFDVELA